MIDIKKITKDYIGEKFWSRGISYFIRDYMTDIELTDEKNYILFDTEIEGNNDFYNVTLGFVKDTQSLIGECSCMSFYDNRRCKHLGALARKIDQEYIINDDLSVVSKKENDLKSNGLKILNKIGQVRNTDEQIDLEDDLYKIKLSFEDHKGDINIGLYKCKILKNGKLSAGTKVYASGMYAVPNKYQKLKLFIEYKKSSNYRSTTPEHMSFTDDPEMFINLVKQYNPIYDTSNQHVYVSKEKGQLKINTINDKKNNTYNISLVVVSKIGEFLLKDIKYYGDKLSEQFAILTKDKHLILCTNTLSRSFVDSIGEGVIELTKEEFEKFKKGPYFENLLENTTNIEEMGIKYTTLVPTNKLLIDIDNSFESIKVEYLIGYGNKSIDPNNKIKTSIIDNGNVIKRDFTQEKQLKNNISDLLVYFDEKEEDRSIYTKYVDENIDDFFDEIEKLIDQGVDIEYKQNTKRVTNKELGASVSIKSGEDWFDANVEMKLGDNVVDEATDIMRAIKQGKNRITLKNGMTIILKEKLQQSLKELEELGINDKNIDDTVKISKFNIGLLKDKKRKGDLIDFALDKDVLKLKKSLSSFKGITKVKLSENIKADLRDYQFDGYHWLNFLSKYNFSGILADDMGLGKTLQTLAILQKEYDKKTLKTQSLIICPTSLVLNWMDEIEKFTPNLRTQYIKNGKTGFDTIKKDTQIVIVSYGMMANLVDNDDFNKKFYYLILDEAQNIKNPVALRTKSIGKIIAKYRLALSGTPIENNLMELWSVFNFLMPGFLGNLSAFKQRYITEEGNIKTLSAKVKPFILRRTKEEVLKDLPPKVEEVIKLEMGEKQKAFYNKLKTTFRLQITKELEENGLNKARFQVLDSLLKLRQACLMPELVNMSGNNLTESIKIKYIEENIEDMIGKGHNLLIFSQFTGFLKYVKVVLNKKGINYNYLDGQVKKENRKKLVDSFNNGDVNVFIISLKAGGTGLNLTSADYVLHLDPWWNPAVENQATDRAHRMGQEKTVFVQKLIIAGSIEEKILTLQEKKKKLIDDVFSGNFSGSLSERDIDFIFE